MSNTPIFKNGFIGSHTLDPQGDVILVLDSKSAIVSNNSEVDLVTAEDWNVGYVTEGSENEQALSTEAVASRASSTGSGNADEHDGISVHSNELSPCGTADIEVRVSSKHLILGSPVFRVLLNQDYREGNTLRNDGTVRIPLPDDPIHGMMVLLKLLHFQFEQYEMTPGLLMQIALLADKYDMATQILYWSRVWCAEIRDNIPKRWKPEVIRYIGLFSMLKIDDLKENMISLARGHVTETTSTFDLPIGYSIQTLQENRSHALDKAFVDLAEMVEKYWTIKTGTIICANELWMCDAGVLGMLLKGFKDKEIWPLPTSPYPGITIDGLADELTVTATHVIQ